MRRLLLLGLFLTWYQPGDCDRVAGWVCAIEAPTAHTTTKWWMPNAPARDCGADASSGWLPAPWPQAGARVWLRTIVRPSLTGTDWSAPLEVAP